MLQVIKKTWTCPDCRKTAQFTDGDWGTGGVCNHCGSDAIWSKLSLNWDRKEVA